jgi:hypothetical protein
MHEWQMTLKWQIEQTFTINGLVYRTHLEWRKSIIVICLYKGEDVLSWKTCIWSYCHVFGQYNMFKLPEGCENIGKSSYLNLPYIDCTTIMAQFSSTYGLQDSLTYMYYISKCLYMSLLYKYIHSRCVL